jgi:hypothetical protein
VNALATEMLDTSVEAQSGNARDIIRARAAARGVLHTVEKSQQPRRSLDEVHDSLGGVVLTADELIDEQRGPR